MESALNLYIMTIFLASSVELYCVNSKFCTPCRKVPVNTFETTCKLPENPMTSVVKIRHSVRDVLLIRCYRNDPPWTMFHFEKNETLSYNVSTVVMEYCAVPSNMLLHEVINLFVPNTFTQLVLDNLQKSLRNLTRNDFDGLSALHVLKISAITMSDLPADLLHDLTSLLQLEIKESLFEKLPTTFFNLPDLEELSVYNNSLKTFETNQFHQLTGLRLLNLAHNQLTELAPSIFKELVSLYNLNLAGNNIERLNSEVFKTLKFMTVINLDKNNFTESGIPQNLFQHNGALLSVSLCHNKRQLFSLPEGLFRNPYNLRSVTITHSRLVVLPPDLLAGVMALENVTLSHNKIQEIPDGFLNDCGLIRRISLAHNEISHLPIDTFRSTSYLRSLDLSYNQLKEFNSELIHTLDFLQILRLNNNQIRVIHDDTKCFDTFWNDETTFEKQSYCPLAIEEVYLSSNELRIIPRKMIVTENLKLMQLDGNELRNITMRDFEYFRGSAKVTVGNNEIETISYTDFEIIESSIEKQITVVLDRNPITCDCKIHDFMKYAGPDQMFRQNRTIRFDIERTFCANPEELRDVALKELDRMTLKCLIEDPTLLNATCPEECQCWDRTEDHAYLIDCSYKNLTAAPLSLRSPKSYHIELNLTGNFIAIMPQMSQPGYLNVTKLILSNNTISNIDLDSSGSLEVLSLDLNNLSKLEPHVMNFLTTSTALKHLELHSNSWICDCNTVDFLKFVQANIEKIINLERVTCATSDYPIFQMAPANFCPVFVGTIIIIGGIIAVLGILLGAVAAIYYSYQYEIKVWLYAKQWCLWLVTEDEVDKAKMFDAFVSFSHLDQIFVTETLIPTLEEGSRPFRLCLHYRDWVPGESISDQIAGSIENSKRTIVVLSPNFLESVWSRIEVRAAHEQALSEGRARVIIVILEDIGLVDDLDVELRAYLQMNTYVRWGDPLFWEKLEYALPHLNYTQKTHERNQNMISMSELKVQYLNNENDTDGNSNNPISK